jgi:hypothetical protein
MQSRRRSGRTVLLWILGLAVIGGFVVLGLIDARMHRAGGPGIIRFEFVADRMTAARILAAWGADGRDAAKLSVWLDYGFLVLYATFLVVALRAAAAGLAARGHEKLAWIASWIWVLAITGAAFDAVEDFALLLILDGDASRLTPLVATVCAVLKFVALIDVAAFLLIASFVLFRDRRRRRANRPKPLPQN